MNKCKAVKKEVCNIEPKQLYEGETNPVKRQVPYEVCQDMHEAAFREEQRCKDKPPKKCHQLKEQVFKSKTKQSFHDVNKIIQEGVTRCLYDPYKKNVQNNEEQCMTIKFHRDKRTKNDKIIESDCHRASQKNCQQKDNQQYKEVMFKNFTTTSKQMCGTRFRPKHVYEEEDYGKSKEKCLDMFKYECKKRPKIICHPRIPEYTAKQKEFGRQRKTLRTNYPNGFWNESKTIYEAYLAKTKVEAPNNKPLTMIHHMNEHKSNTVNRRKFSQHLGRPPDNQLLH